jgi:hypothetical protein
MAKLEFEHKETLSPHDAVKRLRAVADAIDGTNPQFELRVASETIEFPSGTRCASSWKLSWTTMSSS